MSAVNTQKDVSQARYSKARAGFVEGGTTLNAWCKANGKHIQNVRDAFFGRWVGKAADQLIVKVECASQMVRPKW